MVPDDNTTPEITAPIARGSKVWLRAFEANDLDAYKTAINDADVAFWAGYTTPAGSDTVRNWYETHVQVEHGKQAYYFVISPLGSRDFAGSIWLWNFGSRLGGAELSIFLAQKTRWSAGIGTDAVNALVDFAFGFLDLSRIWLITRVENLRAQRAFTKAGFSVEGTIRGHTIRRGKVLDSVQMSMLRIDWERLERPRSWDYLKSP